MGVTEHVLNIQSSNNKKIVPLYDTPTCSYTGRSLPIKLANGSTVYAPLGVTDDLYGTQLWVEIDGTSYRVVEQSVQGIQGVNFDKTVKIEFGGSDERTAKYDTFYFVAPRRTKFHYKSMVNYGQTGWGYSSDKWQRSDIWINLDGSLLVKKTFRRSAGINWKTLYDGDIELDAGTHRMELWLLGQGSSKDSHLTVCYAWNNDLLMSGQQFVQYSSPGTYDFTVPKGVENITIVTVGGGGGGAGYGYTPKEDTDDGGPSSGEGSGGEGA